jgi:hypothetical protein
MSDSSGPIGGPVLALRGFPHYTFLCDIRHTHTAKPALGSSSLPDAVRQTGKEKIQKKKGISTRIFNRKDVNLNMFT